MTESLSFLLKSVRAHSLINPKINKKDYVVLDLSMQNKELSKIELTSSKGLENFILNHIKRNNAKVAYGGYLEKRSIYQRSDYFSLSDSKNNRNIHLGIDIWIEAGSIVYAPLEGEIHSFKNNTNFGDYGPTIILEHNINCFKFYTLYGHLSLSSIKNKVIGEKVKKGQQIATLGTKDINGDYPPHLHFQIIINIQDYRGDYPGVSSQLEIDFYKMNCPDPNLLLKL